MDNDYHKVKGKHGRGGFASLNKGKDGLTGPERARIAGRRGAIARAIKVYHHKEEEFMNE